MPKVNVYLPDDLFERVRRLKLPVSAICQTALSEALARIAAVTENAKVAKPSLPEDLRIELPIGQHLHDILALSYPSAASRGSADLEPEDMLAAVLDQGESLLLLLLEQHGFGRERLRRELDAVVPRSSRKLPVSRVRMTDRARDLIDHAVLDATKSGAAALTGRHLFLALASSESVAGHVIRRLEIDKVLTRSLFDASDAGVMFGAHGSALGRQDDVLATMWTELRARLETIDERLYRMQRDPDSTGS